MEMLSESKLQTISSPPSGFSARFTGVLPTSRRASSLSDFKSIEATCAEPEHAMNALLLSGRMATSSGWWQIGTVLRTEKVRASIRETESLARLLTTTVFPSGETLASPGESPTRTVAITLRWSRSMTETLADPELAKYARVPSEETSIK